MDIIYYSKEMESFLERYFNDFVKQSFQLNDQIFYHLEFDLIDIKEKYDNKTLILRNNKKQIIITDTIYNIFHNELETKDIIGHIKETKLNNSFSDDFLFLFDIFYFIKDRESFFKWISSQQLYYQQISIKKLYDLNHNEYKIFIQSMPFSSIFNLFKNNNFNNVNIIYDFFKILKENSIKDEELIKYLSKKNKLNLIPLVI